MTAIAPDAAARPATGAVSPSIVIRTGGGSAAAPRDTVLRDAIPPPVEKHDLDPVMANDGSGLPFELWRGLSNDQVETLISQLQIPPSSPALH
ncbi:MAG TPA: hypothetical protein PLD46_10095, partial [Hyphomicrobium sp.]|nr:hypothetical protein [Hyphomicrobium sp.]